MKKTITAKTFFHKRIQAFVANLLFPVGKGDWYKSKGYGKTAVASDETAPFRDFVTQQKEPNALYYKAFDGLNLSLSKVSVLMTSKETASLEVMQCKPESDSPKKPGTGKHIIYFPGANTYYQACFRDISAASKETGATVHAFNFPGTGLSSGKVREANDLINAGLSVVFSLINKGVHPDEIILQGDCYGAGIALEVKKQLEKQASVKVRLIMNNAFKSFKAAVYDIINQSTNWFPYALKNIIKKLLQFTGWHLTPGKKYKHADPYQCHIQHLDDLTLTSSALSKKIGKYKHEITSKKTQSKKRDAITDSCPEEYKKDRDILDKKHYVRVKESAKERLGKKFGVDKFDRVNAHFADLCELEMLDGQSVYTGFINDYILRSDSYIQKNPQESINIIQEKLSKLHFLNAADSVALTIEEAKEFDTLITFLKGNEANDLSESPPKNQNCFA